MSQWYDLDALSYSPDNPNEGDIGGIYGSIKQHGYRDVVQVFGQQVKAGQHRLEALKWHLKEGYQATERDKCLRRGEQGQWQVEGLALDDMAPHQATAFMLAHNELTRRGHNDEAILAEVLAGLATEYEGETLAEATGYSAEALDDLLQDLAHEALQEGESEADRLSKADEYQAKWQVERGAIYRVGRHRLMCGDSTSQEDVQALMDGKWATLLASDPPYNVSIDYGGEIDDDRTAQEYETFTRAWFTTWQAVSDRQIVTPGGVNLLKWCHFFEPYHVAVWTKLNALTRGKISICWAWEPVFFFGASFKRERHSDVFDFPIGMQKDTGGHPCPKPLNMWIDLISNYSVAGDIVADAFDGSGTTLVACEQTGRVGFGMEIHPPYVAVTLERLTALGLEAVRER